VSAWKDLERKVCRALGSSRRGQVAGSGWAQGSDNDETGPFSIETKRTKSGMLRRAWIEQARRQGKAEKRPWALIVAKHNDKRPIIVLDFWEFAKLAQDAGWLGDINVHESTDRLERLERAMGPMAANVDEKAHLAAVMDDIEVRRGKLSRGLD
jgi:hypothetical protein